MIIWFLGANQILSDQQIKEEQIWDFNIFYSFPPLAPLEAKGYSKKCNLTLAVSPTCSQH